MTEHDPYAGPGSPRLDRLRRTGVVAVIRAPSATSALRAVDALVAGGITGIEITYSTPTAAAVIAELSRRYGDEILLGAGTVLTAGQAREAAGAGARFLVSPGTTSALAQAMLGTGVDVLLGAMTPSELMRALELGAHVVKLFPAGLGGPSFLRSLRGPFPDVAIMPTGGVTLENLGQWLSAGAIAVGAGSELCAPALLARGDWDELTERAGRFAAARRECDAVSSAAVRGGS